MASILQRLHQQVIRCQRCPRLVHYRHHVARQKVRRFQEEIYWGKAVPSFGDPAARLLIVGLAPAAHGGNRTGRAFTGDRSGDWLYEALYAHGFASQPTSTRRDDGLILRDCYITQVLHCAPPANKPTAEEVRACQPYMLAEWQLLPRVRVIVPLGHLAFTAFLRIYRQALGALAAPQPRFAHARAYTLPCGRLLLPSYHPSQQNTQTGRLTRPMLHDIFATARDYLGSPESA